MKKNTVIISISIFLILVIFSGIYIFFKNINNENENNNDAINASNNIEVYPKENDNDNDIDNSNINIEDNKYIDDNPIKIGLYSGQGNTKKLVTEYTSNWDAENIMGIFYAIATNEETVSGASYGSLWIKYWNNYQNISSYKIGYNIKFTMSSGETTDQIILNPDHAYLMYPKLQFYLYDDINLVPGKPYYHVTQDTVTEKTQYTSIKLVGDKNTKDIISPIELTVFTYDDDNDFNPISGKYSGNSYYTVLLYKK